MPDCEGKDNELLSNELTTQQESFKIKRMFKIEIIIKMIRITVLSCFVLPRRRIDREKPDHQVLFLASEKYIAN